MDAVVNFKGTPQELDVIREALATLQAVNTVKSKNKDYLPNERRDFREMATRAADLYRKIA